MKKLLAFIIGLIAAYIHWVGLIVGGILVGITAESNKKALTYGFALGFVVWILFVIYLALLGVVDKYVSMGPLFYLSMVLPVVTSTLSASVRSIF
ncbi:hypothetical protein DRP04_08865 [Archaeoglobales archaeon]|nr:MAG: hypothetical protein DRP04_08865 [Archaeoglobales archaeon]